jgi:hypothetical protein
MYILNSADDNNVLQVNFSLHCLVNFQKTVKKAKISEDSFPTKFSVGCAVNPEMMLLLNQILLILNMFLSFRKR